jgi:predicted transcriptional regulator
MAMAEKDRQAFLSNVDAMLFMARRIIERELADGTDFNHVTYHMTQAMVPMAKTASDELMERVFEAAARICSSMHVSAVMLTAMAEGGKDVDELIERVQAKIELKQQDKKDQG